MNWHGWAIVAYSFGRRELLPGKSNEALAQNVKNVYACVKVPLILQKEIAQCVDTRHVPKLVLVITKHRKRGQYLDTEEVTLQAVQWMKKKRISHVFLVAHPFLHRTKCEKLLHKHGIEVFSVKTGWIPFDKNSDQWWTRGPVRLLVYAILQILFRRRGH